METVLRKQSYLERKREIILNLGYDFVIYRNRAKKSLKALKKQIISLQSQNEQS